MGSAVALGLGRRKARVGLPASGKRRGASPRLQQRPPKQPAARTLPGWDLWPRRRGIPEGRPGHSLVALRAEARGLVILGAVDVGAVVERAVPAADGPAAPLVHEVPVEAGVGPVLCAFVLHEERALLRAEFLQVPAGTAPGGGPGRRMEPRVARQEVCHMSPEGPRAKARPQPVGLS